MSFRVMPQQGFSSNAAVGRPEKTDRQGKRLQPAGTDNPESTRKK